MIINVIEPIDPILVKAFADMQKGFMVEPIRRIMEYEAQRRMFAPIDPLPNEVFPYIDEPLEN